MGEFVQHEPCPACESKDNLARYADGSAYCFGCGHNIRATGDVGGATYIARKEPMQSLQPVTGSFEPLSDRGITKETCEKYRYRVYWKESGMVHAADYFNAKGERIAQHVRYPDKGFSWYGSNPNHRLFGQQLWKPSKNIRVVVTEGEIDCLSMAQVQGLKWPVVSIPNGADAAKTAFQRNLEWLEGFKEVVILFDQDKAGQKAAAQCAELLSPGKAYIASLPLKDANEMLVAGRVKELIQAQWDASPYRPDGIIAGPDLIDRVLAPPPPSIIHPWAGLDTLLRGQRYGEITTWCGGTGAGKSQLLREVAFNLHSKGQIVGVVALEENVKKAAQSQVSLFMGKRLHDPTIRPEIPDKKIREAAKKALERMYFYDHFGSIEADVLIPKIRFMAKGLGVQWVILDHISIMVAGMAGDGRDRERIDELITKLRTIVEECQIGMHLVCHLRKAAGTPFEEGGRISMDDLRGSAALKQTSDNIIAAERDQQAESDEARDTTTLRVLKCREFGDTGLAAKVHYSKDTGRILELPRELWDSHAVKGTQF